MTEQMLNAIKHDEEFQDFRKNWTLDAVHERKNGFDASLVSRTAKGWMEATQLTANTDENEKDEEMRQEWVDFYLEQAEERLLLTGKFPNCKYILPCEAAIHTLHSSKKKDAYFFTVHYSNNGALVPIGKQYTADSKETRKLAMDICRALSEIHGADSVHKNICPENIFRLENGTYCLGRAGIEEDAEHLKKKGFYPHEKYDVQSDIFMLGQCLTRIHQTENMSSGEARKMTAIINKACHSDSSLRYQTAEEMLAALENRIDKKKIFLFAGIGGAAVLLILLGCVLAAALGSKPKPEKPQDSVTESVTDPAATEAPSESKETEPTTTEAATEPTTTETAPPETKEPQGDPNNDGRVDVFDAVKVLEISVSGNIDGEDGKNYDFNGDGEVNVMDSVDLLRYSAYVAAGGTESFTDFIADKEE